MRTILVASTISAVLALWGGAASADPAVVIRGDGCGLFDGNGDFAFTTDTQIVATQSQDGNAHLRCQADVPPSSSGGAAKFDFESTGSFCGILTPFDFEVTDQWHETVSASGKATLICHVK